MIGTAYASVDVGPGRHKGITYEVGSCWIL